MSSSSHTITTPVPAEDAESKALQEALSKEIIEAMDNDDKKEVEEIVQTIDQFELSKEEKLKVAKTKEEIPNQDKLYADLVAAQNEFDKWADVAVNHMYLLCNEGTFEAKQKRYETHKQYTEASKRVEVCVKRFNTAHNAHVNQIRSRFLAPQVKLVEAFHNEVPYSHSSLSPIEDKEDQNRILTLIASAFKNKHDKELIALKAGRRKDIFQSVANLGALLANYKLSFPQWFIEKYTCTYNDDEIIARTVGTKTNHN